MLVSSFLVDLDFFFGDFLGGILTTSFSFSLGALSADFFLSSVSSLSVLVDFSGLVLDLLSSVADVLAFLVDGTGLLDRPLLEVDSDSGWSFFLLADLGTGLLDLPRLGALSSWISSLLFSSATSLTSSARSDF